MKMNIKNVFLGYNIDTNNRDFNKYKLLLIPFKDSILRNDISKQINLRNDKLQNLYKAWENLSGMKKSFSITSLFKNYNSKRDNLLINSNNYYFEMILQLSKILFDKNAKLPLFRSYKDLLNSKNNKYVYRYVIYVGTLNNKSNEKMFSIFPIKKNFLLRNHRVLYTIFTPKFSTISTNKLIQLPFKKSDDIANFYVTRNSYTLQVYKPLIFDDIFNTDNIKKIYAIRTLKRFRNKKLYLTKNNVNVKFITKPGNVNDIKNAVLQSPSLLDSISTFTGNRNSNIQRISSKDLINVINQLNIYAHKHAGSCPFTTKNIPYFDKRSNSLGVTSKSIPIFCSLLKNDIVQKLLTGQIDVPYYSNE